MSEKNIQIRNKNGASWDNLYPITKGANVLTNDGKNVEQHVANTDIHVTTTDKTTWNNKQDALGYVPENIANKNANNGYAGLDANGKLPTNLVPSVAIVDTFSASNQAEQLALTVQKGDVCVRTDLSKSFINKTGNNTSMSDWQELLTPNDAVTSVNGKVGVVSLLTTDINEGTNKYYTDERVSANTDVVSNTAHRNSAHAPANAQKNSDITKAEIEAKLTGVISSHTHASSAPTAHASTHITGGTDVIPNAVANGNAGLMSGADKAKIDGISQDAVKVVVSDTDPTTANADFWFAVV